MARTGTKSQPTWSDLKGRLAGFDRQGLLGLVQDLYAAHKDNRLFLHTRFGLGEDPLEPYKETIDRWLWPSAFGKQSVSVAKAKEAVSSYRKAVGDPAGLAELMVFFCETGAGFCKDLGFQDENYFDALVRLFGEALIHIRKLPEPAQETLIDRLDHVRVVSHDFGYGVGDDLDSLLARSTRRLA